MTTGKTYRLVVPFLALLNLPACGSPGGSFAAPSGFQDYFGFGPSCHLWGLDIEPSIIDIGVGEKAVVAVLDTKPRQIGGSCRSLHDARFRTFNWWPTRGDVATIEIESCNCEVIENSGADVDIRMLEPHELRLRITVRNAGQVYFQIRGSLEDPYDLLGPTATGTIVVSLR